ncbi:MAG: hypothetical protein PWP23_477 [Candidatus Sumerlaeota bacterium]|nr:hypothetical protein [Candidatus Sumerlaeota bacterium]
MTELPWLETYDGQTTEELLALEGKYRTDSLVAAFEEALASMADGSHGFSYEEVVILAVEALEYEVNNGGYMQFFVNASEFVPLAIDALESIGRTDALALTRRAIEVIGIKGEVTAEAVEAAIEEENPERDEKLEELDEKYFEEIGDLSDDLFAYIKANKDEIVLTESESDAE